ncbi:hypothetical protein QCA50_004214 [Cerrena zonata]|uniref:PIN-like protein n=1 Tax=Cerrena zonata TaxID=2478898 RepID=A0AAW0GNC2_9APHY
MPPNSSLLASFLGALEGTVSVLITLYAGYYIGRTGQFDRATVKRVSKVCTTIFLPCLIVVQMGPGITVHNLSKVWIIPIWGLISTLAAHGIGWIGQRFLSLPYWIIVAAGRPNANALPLLLLQSLQYTNVFEDLSAHGESTSDTLERAKSLILLNAIVQQSFTYQTAPQILKLDKPTRSNPNDSDEENPAANLAPETVHHLPSIIQDRERVGLLDSSEHPSYGTTNEEYTEALHPILDQPDVHWPNRFKRPLSRVTNWFSPPLMGAIVAIIIGITPQLHKIFYMKDSAVYTSLTQSLKNLGDLFVALQSVVVGAELALVPHANPGKVPAIFTLTVRFVIMPALSLLFVWGTAGRGWYTDDKLVWFLLVLIPSGPSAMLLASVAEIVNTDQGPICGYLAISYLLSPLIAVVCSLALETVKAVEHRVT